MIDDIDLVIEDLVSEALDGLPPVFLEQLGSVAIVIEDEPTADQLASVKAHGLYGLYQGVPRTAYGGRLCNRCDASASARPSRR